MGHLLHNHNEQSLEICYKINSCILHESFKKHYVYIFVQQKIYICNSS